MKKRIEMIIKQESKSIKIKNVKKVSEFEKGRGLMFHPRKDCPAMLFEFAHPTNIKIHSLFVFFPFLAVWLDNKNTIVDLKKIKPFELSAKSNKQFYKLLEIPINKKYSNQIKTILKIFNNR